MYESQRRNLARDLKDDEIRIIGVEFTVQTDSGINQELAMFATDLVIPRGRDRGNAYWPKITFHTTDGDFVLDSRQLGRSPNW